MRDEHEFTWVVPGVLGAMRHPHDLRSALESLKDEGIDGIVTLTERELNASLIEEFGFEYHHIPITDYAAPRPEQVDEFVGIVQRAAKAGRKIVVHCLAGRGRTGTLAACYLVSVGRSPEEAIREIRRLRPGSVETPEQEETVAAYARRLKRPL